MSIHGRFPLAGAYVVVQGSFGRAQLLPVAQVLQDRRDLATLLVQVQPTETGGAAPRSPGVSLEGPGVLDANPRRGHAVVLGPHHPHAAIEPVRRPPPRPMTGESGVPDPSGVGQAPPWSTRAMGQAASVDAGPHPESSGVIRLEILGQLREALAQALATNRALVDGADWQDRRDTAEGLASGVLQTLGLALPEVSWSALRGASSGDGRISIGQDLARALSLPALTALLLHESGRAQGARASGPAEVVLQTLLAGSFISRELADHVGRAPDGQALVLAALGGWLFDPTQRARSIEWLTALDHARHDEDRREHDVDVIALLVSALDRASAKGTGRAPPWAFGDPVV